MENLRDSITNTLLNSTKKNFVLECATGLGKTYLALQKVQQLYSPDCKILIVIPRNVLIQNWIDEFKKWHYDDMLSNVTFVTYMSLPKMAGTWDISIFDEAHHLSERCREALKSFCITHSLFLSATINKDIRWFINSTYNRYNELQWIKVDTKDSIDNNILPDPLILLFPMTLDNKEANQLYVSKKSKASSKTLTVNYKSKWKHRGYKGTLILRCTQQQYYNELSGLIEWYKQKRGNPIMKNIWLHKAGERLKWLARQKTAVVKDMLSSIQGRAVVFCSSIEHSEELGIPCVNSKIGTENLDKFNKGKLNNIACVNMIDEGLNLYNCQVGIFDMLNSSLRVQVQRIGRILRHKKPVIIIPYFKNTREEEILKKMLEGYDKNHIKVLMSTDVLKNLKG